jgi:hypothetical protein
MERKRTKNLFITKDRSKYPKYVGCTIEANAASMLPGLETVRYEDGNHDYEGWVKRSDFERYVRTIEWYAIMVINSFGGWEPLKLPDNIYPEMITFLEKSAENHKWTHITWLVEFAYEARGVLFEQPLAKEFWVEVKS